MLCLQSRPLASPPATTLPDRHLRRDGTSLPYVPTAVASTSAAFTKHPPAALQARDSVEHLPLEVWDARTPGVQVRCVLQGATEESPQLPGPQSRAGWLPRELHPYGHRELIHHSRYVEAQLPGLSRLQRDSPRAGLDTCLWLDPKPDARRGVRQCHPVTSPARLPAALCSVLRTIFPDLLMPVPLLPTVFPQSISLSLQKNKKEVKRCM